MIPILAVAAAALVGASALSGSTSSEISNSQPRAEANSNASDQVREPSPRYGSELAPSEAIGRFIV